MISTLKMAANGGKTKQADGSIDTCSSKDKCLGDVVDYDEFEKADFNLVSGYNNGNIGKTHVDIAKVNGDDKPTISCYVDSNENITATKLATK